MKTAPIQLKPIAFRRVNVELDGKHFAADGLAADGLPTDLDRINIATHVSFSPVEEPEAPGSAYFLVLRVVIDNTGEGGGETRYSPYLVDIEAGALIQPLPSAEVIADIENIVVVNGTSMLWSAIREQVCTLTARMPAGQLMLPTVNFLDLKRKRDDNSGNEARNKKAKATARRKRAAPSEP